MTVRSKVRVYRARRQSLANLIREGVLIDPAEIKRVRQRTRQVLMPRRVAALHARRIR